MPDCNVRFNVAQLLKGPTGACRDYDLSCEVQGLDTELELDRPVVGRVSLMRTNQGILVTGDLRTGLLAVCRRCLEACSIDAHIRLEEEYYSVSHLGPGPSDEVPYKERDEALLIDDRHTLDLTEVLRQELILAALGQDICRPDCAGLCPRCGENLNLGECSCEGAAVDPRWASLQALLSTEKT